MRRIILLGQSEGNKNYLDPVKESAAVCETLSDYLRLYDHLVVYTEMPKSPKKSDIVINVKFGESEDPNASGCVVSAPNKPEAMRWARLLAFDVSQALKIKDEINNNSNDIALQMCYATNGDDALSYHKNFDELILSLVKTFIVWT